MKHLLIILEGMADMPQPLLDGKTPLAAARVPQLTALAATGACGLVRPPRDLRAFRPTAMLGSLLGIPADEARQLHRAPFEALAAGIPVLLNERIFRSSFVTLRDDVLAESSVALSIDETVALCEVLEPAARAHQVRLDPLRPGHLLALFKDGGLAADAGLPPHAIEGRPWAPFLPKGPDNASLREFLSEANEVLSRHPVNEVRVDLGENPANGLWLWGGGGEPAVSAPFGGRALKACMITNSLMARGLARLCRMTVAGFRDPASPGGSGTALDVGATVTALRDHDLAVVYIAARREIGRHGNPRDKALALQAIDFHVLAPLREIAAAHRPCRVLVTTDAGIDSGSQCSAEVDLPFALAGDGVVPDDCARWDEVSCQAGRMGTLDPSALFERLMNAAL